MSTGETPENYTEHFLNEVAQVSRGIDKGVIEAVVSRLRQAREDRGRVFIIGVGGSAANAAHAAGDLRALAGIEAYAPAEWVSAFTASANDQGWVSSFSQLLVQSNLSPVDVLLVLSVGGGSYVPPVSENLIEAVSLAEARSADVIAIVGPRGGVMAERASLCVRIPVSVSQYETTHSEIFQAVAWHLIATHPSLKVKDAFWESIRVREA